VELLESQPNPVTSTTTIGFILHPEVCAKGHVPTVSLQIYNVLVQVVAVPMLDVPQGRGGPIVNVKLPCGTYEAVWDGRLQDGRPAQTGVYYSQLIVDGQRYTQKLIVLGVSLVLMVLLNVVVNYTKTGKAMRAVSYNLDAAKLMGINTDRIIALTFAFGSALAAAGGILVSLLYPKIDPLMGVMPGLKAFVAAVLGGIGNITGAMLGGLILGFAEVMAVGYGSSTYRDAIAFVVLVLILLFKPGGIMGKGTVEKV